MNKIQNTYSDFSKSNIWNSLLSMLDTFHEKSIELADKLNLFYNIEEAENVRNYIREMKNKD